MHAVNLQSETGRPAPRRAAAQFNQSLEATGRIALGLPQERWVVRNLWLPVPQLCVSVSSRD
jgi:hypothetical protein